MSRKKRKRGKRRHPAGSPVVRRDYEISFERLDESRWRIPRSGAMRVDGIIHATEPLFEAIRGDQSPRQVAAVATLPGIVGASLAMPDIHWGYGFPIGGVAAFDERTGVVSPGGVGYDINCGVRMHVLDLDADAAARLAAGIADALAAGVPAGLGSVNPGLSLSGRDLDSVLTHGAAAAVELDRGGREELAHLESKGCIPDADPSCVSKRARERGIVQLGTLGSGNHFVELDRVDEIIDPAAAESFGLGEGSTVLSVHTGSRGLGHQVCDDYIRVMLEASRKYAIELPDRQLCCAPLGSEEAGRYLGAMACAANFAFANRHVVAHMALRAMERFLAKKSVRFTHGVLYDVAHNIAKWEVHDLQGARRRLLVHRKGATRALGPGHEELPRAYRETGQPVLIPGDMGRSSWVLAGSRGSRESTFSSACHGAGRLMSRSQAARTTRAGHVVRSLEERGIQVRAASKDTLVEEFPGAYKDVDEVVRAVQISGLARPVARLVPLVVVKG
jgi:tRNA-splicing ligase RtcB